MNKHTKDNIKQKLKSIRSWCKVYECKCVAIATFIVFIFVAASLIYKW